MHAVETFTILYIAIALLAYLCVKLAIPYPLLLVLGGLGLSRVPNLPRVDVPPEYIFLVFLPPLLYHAAILTSWRDFRANLRPISVLAVGLTLFTTAAVAIVAHQVLPDSPGRAPFCSVRLSPRRTRSPRRPSPKDFTFPKRIITILEGESLVNDAIALVAYRFALAAVTIGGFSIFRAGGEFVIVSIGGVAIGLLVGVVVAFVRSRIHEPAIEGVVSLLTPYLAYVPAERLHLSGVLSAVACGLYMARRLSHFVSPESRIRNYAVWDAITFLLNGLVFILIGFELPEILREIGDIPTGLLIAYATCISLTAILVRIVWVFTASYIPRKLFPKLAAKDPMPSVAAMSMIGWTGMAGSSRWPRRWRCRACCRIIRIIASGR